MKSEELRPLERQELEDWKHMTFMDPYGLALVDAMWCTLDTLKDTKGLAHYEAAEIARKKMMAGVHPESCPHERQHDFKLLLEHEAAFAEGRHFDAGPAQAPRGPLMPCGCLDAHIAGKLYWAECARFLGSAGGKPMVCKGS